MRTFFTALVLLLTLVHPLALVAQNAASPEEMEERAGLVYKSGDQKPYTGLVLDYHQSGKTRLEAHYTAGKLISSKLWYENGRTAEEVSV